VDDAHLRLLAVMQAASPVDGDVSRAPVEFHSAANGAACVLRAVLVQAAEHWAVLTHSITLQRLFELLLRNKGNRVAITSADYILHS
jgi:hypothetical protein